MLRVAESYGNEPLSAAERQIAVSIIEAILPEAEVDVRRRLAETLKASPHLHRGLARRMATDVLEVASPILIHSLALTDEDLLEVIERCGIEHARTMAQRNNLSVVVSDALIRTDDETVVLRVAANNNARISTEGFHHMLNRFGDHTKIVETVSARQALPLAVVERLTALVTGRVLERLISRYAVSAHRVGLILHHSREHFLLQSVAGEPAEELRAFAQRLEDNRLLGPSLITRALAVGQFGFLFQALSIKAGIPITNVRRLISDEGGRGQGELFDHCGLDKAYKDLFVRLIYAARSFPATRDGRPPAGWVEVAEPILKEGLEHYDPEWNQEQLVTEALIEIEEQGNGTGENGGQIYGQQRR